MNEKGGSIKTWKETLFYLGLAAFIVAGAALYVIQNSENTCPVPVPVVSVKKSAAVEAVLIEYILKHSNRCSRSQAKEMVDEAFKTDKPLLILAIIQKESDFVLTALSPAGAMGLTQVMPVTKSGTDVWEKHLIKKGIIKERRDLFEIGPSIAAGNEVLTIYLNEAKGNVEDAFFKYLSGRDGWYSKKILENLATLYILVEGVK